MAFQLGSFQADAFQIDQIDWMSALSEPPANTHARPVVYQQSYIAPDRFGANPGRDAMDWHRPLDEPIVKVRKPVAYQQELAYEPFYNYEPSDSIGWFRSLSEPSKNLAPRPVAYQQSYIAPDRFGSNPGRDAIDWWLPLSEPYDPVRKPVAEQQHLIRPVPYDLLSEGTMQWFRPFSEPYKKVRDPVVWQQSYIEPDPEEEINPGAGTEYDWYMALSEPAKFLERPRLDTSIQATYSIAFQKGDPFIYDYKNLFWLRALHDEQVDLIGKHLTGSSLIRLAAEHSDSITLTAKHETTIDLSAVNLVDGETDATIGAFQVDAFWNRAFQTQQNFSNSLTVRILTGKK